MFPLDYALAVVLLAAPPDTADPPEALQPFLTVRPTAQSLAVDWEVLDPREVRYVLARAEDFPADLKMLRNRYQNLADAPPLSEAARFPDRAMVNELLTFNRTYRQYLTVRQPVDLVHGDELRIALNETDHLYQVWDSVRDARCNYYYVTVRRHALKKLRETIGPEDYYAGRLPPHVPVWRFQRID